MNKGLEVIEAHELFGVDFDRIEVVVHPQSVVHGMVEFTDGATIAQLSMPDMRLPIGLALGAPTRLDQAFGADRLDHARIAHLRAPRPRGLPVPRARLRRRPGRWGRPGRAERGQRGGGRGLPRPAGSRGSGSPRSSTRCSRREPGTSRTSQTFWKRTGSRASAPGSPSPTEQPREVPCERSAGRRAARRDQEGDHGHRGHPGRRSRCSSLAAPVGRG